MTPAATTRTSTSPSHGSGRSTSVGARTSGPPIPTARTARIRSVPGLVANKWTALVLAFLAEEPHRYGELRRRAEGVSQKVFTQVLRNPERDGLVSRKVLPTSPPSVEYAITRLGGEVAALLTTLKEWSETRFDEVLAARADFDTRTDAAALAPAASPAGPGGQSDVRRRTRETKPQLDR
ncbi:helix-turn-helix domain-containing protein [Streptomyces olivoreticuli]